MIKPCTGHCYEPEIFAEVPDFAASKLPPAVLQCFAAVATHIRDTGSLEITPVVETGKNPALDLSTPGGNGILESRA